MTALLRTDPAAGTLRLVCLPHAGGGASSFARWAALFPPWIALVRVQLPGREDLAGRPAFRDVPEAVSALLPHLGGPPVALYGHSMGALLTFELARALTGHGTPPVHLFVSGRRAPHLAATRPPIHELPDERFADELEAVGAGPGRSPVFRRYALPLIRADLRLSEDHRHVPGPPLPCPLTVFHGLHDPIVSAAEAGAWRRHTAGAFALRAFPGDHFFHHRHRAALAAAMTRALE
ncbi:thioesterase II family protein [Amycolatopsis tucumanensis]|uniref:Alpha/beta fold hydrolase n=1 Tax=Amycolatopsis tucumanensis TaxID=401106 RepID=A0ABP7HDQ1_9PSEU|nr:alpha/beta fold hydrolase [Amycolatopsis tucumanensis]MCF6421402.1 alpha/beta fold hydrolase [Amycolatopsis tucumanensis]